MRCKENPKHYVSHIQKMSMRKKLQQYNTVPPSKDLFSNDRLFEQVAKGLVTLDSKKDSKSRRDEDKLQIRRENSTSNLNFDMITFKMTTDEDRTSE
jgi:hypothetical protein